MNRAEIIETKANEINNLDFESDIRTICKYGRKCYQKNNEHHKKYKHPPNVNIEKSLVHEEIDDNCAPPLKKRKLEGNDIVSHEGANQSSSTKTSPKDSGSTEVSDDDDVIFAQSSNSPLDAKQSIKLKYLVDMPQDFYDLWSYFKTINSLNPGEALRKFGLTAVGPYDIVSEKSKLFSKRNSEDDLCHWRFYYDPPEFQTVLVGNENEYRIGYFRDVPSEVPAFVASMSSTKQGMISPLGENIFAAIRAHLTSQLGKIDLFKKADLSKSLKSLENYAKENSYSLELKTPKMKERQSKIVAKTFHGAGMVVPVDKVTDVGYREIPETDACLKKILKKIVESPDENTKKANLATLQELMTNAQWATDEGDFGMALELGIDLFIFGGQDFHKFIKHLLTVAYELLDRKPFATILNAHLKNRRKGHFECT